ncbi:MAG TPA: DUF362 domain-containing protein [Acidobacteriota bacterium]|nr:DUF362 domain-containing protein [Acidobacteriota bacterium]
MSTTIQAIRVAVARVDGNVQDAVRQAMELAHWKNYLKAGKPTALKVNLGWDLFIPGSITSPWVVEGVIATISGWVGPIYLVEADQVLENIEKAYQKSGLPEICEKYDVQWVNMSRSPAKKIPVPGGRVFQTLEIPEILLETQLITIPVMKTHAKTQITGAIKNQWGCISKLRHNFHLVLTDALADINSVVLPSFAVMDATVGLEGNGPKSGHPRVIDRVLASPDIVAIDTVQGHMMGLNPATISHVQACAERGLGVGNFDRIELVGESDARQANFKFVRAKHNLVSKIEEYLRRSRLRRLVFDTPVFLLMLIGAKFWYFLWLYLFNGKRHWKTILDHPLYGKEWSEVRATVRK